MKPIIVKDQVRLGPGRCLTLTMAGMYYRLTRSAITVLILALAVAFLAYILFYGILAHDSEYHAAVELSKTRMQAEWMSRLSSPDDNNTILSGLLGAEPGRLEEYLRWSGIEESDFARLRQIAVKVKGFCDYFSRISVASRAVLIADAEPLMLAARLTNVSIRSRFIQQVEALKLKMPLGSADALRKFTEDEFVYFQNVCGRIRAAHAAAIDSVRAFVGDRDLQRLFADADGGLKAILLRLGFSCTDSIFRQIAEISENQIHIRTIGSLAAHSLFAPRIAREAAIKRDKLNAASLLAWLANARNARWLLHEVGRQHEAGLFEPERIVEVAQFFLRTSALQAIAGEKAPQLRRGIFSLEPRIQWLIVVSFLVCLVGITNTMLMSVTERFSEIATMKCLGAMDGFVMQLFVFEAMFQGIAGSLIGVALGFALALGRCYIAYSDVVFEAIDWRALGAVATLSFVTGIVVSAVAAMWPSWTASRLAPMEAMRVE